MAKLYITEYAAAGQWQGNPVPLALTPGLENGASPMTIGASAQSSTFNPSTTLVRLHTDGICSVAFGTNPTATTSNARLNANQTEYFAVPQNLSFKVAVVTNT